MASHGLKNCGVAQSPRGLHHRKGFGGPTIDHGIQRRRLHPEVVDRAQQEHRHSRIMDDLHGWDTRKCGAPTEERFFGMEILCTEFDRTS